MLKDAVYTWLASSRKLFPMTCLHLCKHQTTCIEKLGNYIEELCTVELYIPVGSILINELFIFSDLSSYHCSQTYIFIISNLIATSLLIIYLQALRCHAKGCLAIQSYFTKNVQQ
jgi:hypothetical protein